MKKRLSSLLVLVCLVCVTLCGCAANKEITANQAVVMMLSDLGKDAGSIGEPHVHTGTYEDQDCYNIYVTLDGEAWVYVISTDGEILTKGPGSHSH